jgi:hypothetical protein
MKSSESVAAIAPALVKAGAALGPIGKDATNPAFRNKYATLDAIMEQVRPVLAAHGLCVLQGVTHPETVDGRVIGLSVETRLLHLSGEWVSTVVTLPVEKATAQGAGSAISYGRRYGLSAILGLTAEDDDGNAASKGPTRPTLVVKRDEPEAGKRLHDRVPATPSSPMSLAKAHTVELKGTRLLDMDPERLASVRAWAVSKANNYVLAACDAILSDREASDAMFAENAPADDDDPITGADLPF